MFYIIIGYPCGEVEYATDFSSLELHTLVGVKITLSEISQSEKDKYHMISFICRI